VLKDPALVTALARRGLERVRSHYSWDGVTDTYERLFRELLGTAG
jgi:glycosyltransferase involved in cell wall biosynthesis